MQLDIGGKPEDGLSRDKDPWFDLDSKLFDIEWACIKRLELFDDDVRELFGVFQLRLSLWHKVRDVEGRDGAKWRNVLLSLNALEEAGIITGGL